MLREITSDSPGELPCALVSPRGQFLLNGPEKAEHAGMPELIPGGYQAMLDELRKHQDRRVTTMDWHC